MRWRAPDTIQDLHDRVIEQKGDGVFRRQRRPVHQAGRRWRDVLSGRASLLAPTPPDPALRTYVEPSPVRHYQAIAAVACASWALMIICGCNVDEIPGEL